MSWIISHAISAVKSETPQIARLDRRLFMPLLDRSPRHLGNKELAVTGSTG